MAGDADRRRRYHRAMTHPPRYDDLPRPPDDPTGLPLSWGVWGPDDQVGTLNRITDATVAAARDEIRTGRRFNINLPLDEPFGLALHGAHRRRAGAASGDGGRGTSRPCHPR